MPHLELRRGSLHRLAGVLLDELADVGRLGDDALGVVVAEVDGVRGLEGGAVHGGLPHDDARVLPEPGADVVAAGLLRDLLVVAVAEGPRLVPEAVPGRRGEGRKRAARGDSKGSEGSCWIFAGGRATRY